MQTAKVTTRGGTRALRCSLVGYSWCERKGVTIIRVRRVFVSSERPTAATVACGMDGRSVWIKLNFNVSVSFKRLHCKCAHAFHLSGLTHASGVNIIYRFMLSRRLQEPREHKLVLRGYWKQVSSFYSKSSVLILAVYPLWDEHSVLIRETNGLYNKLNFTPSAILTRSFLKPFLFCSLEKWRCPV